MSRAERVLVNYFYSAPVGHAVEALRYCLGYHAADPSREVAVALNSATAVELAGFCDFVSNAYAIDHPLAAPCPDSVARLAAIPANWDWVLDDVRRSQPFQFELYPGLRDYYRATDKLLEATRGRTFAGSDPPGYVPHQQLRFRLPEAARIAGARRLNLGAQPTAKRIALMPAGSGQRALYPSLGSWLMMLDALSEAFPGVQIALLGKLTGDRRTASSFSGEERAGMLAHHSRPVDCFDIELAEQLAVVAASGLFLAPHTGFGLAALAVGTPWLAISGGRWYEYFFNGVPFRSIIPDPSRYHCYSQFEVAPTVSDDGPRAPTMARGRIREDLPRIIDAARELLDGSLSYEQALGDYFADLLAAHRGDATAISSIDGAHLEYVSN